MRRMMMVVTLYWFWAAIGIGATIELTDGVADVEALLRIPVPAGMLEAKPGQVAMLTDEKGARSRHKWSSPAWAGTNWN